MLNGRCDATEHSIFSFTLSVLSLCFQSMLAAEIASIRREQDQRGKSSPSLPLMTLITKRGYFWQLFLVVMVFLGSEFCGINAIGMYSNEIFIRAGIPAAQVTYASLLVYFVQFLVSLAGVSAKMASRSQLEFLSLERVKFHDAFFSGQKSQSLHFVHLMNGINCMK